MMNRGGLTGFTILINCGQCPVHSLAETSHPDTFVKAVIKELDSNPGPLSYSATTLPIFFFFLRFVTTRLGVNYFEK